MSPPLNSTPTPKMLVAAELLDEALRLFYAGKYHASLHLAGGAEEIFGKYVKRTGEQNAYESGKLAASRISVHFNDDKKPTSPDVFGKRMVYARNRTKHQNLIGDDEVLFDPKEEARDMLDRAVTDYYTVISWVELPETELIKRFNQETTLSWEEPDEDDPIT